MKAETTIALARYVRQSLELAAKSAVTPDEWMNINQSAGILIDELRQIEIDVERHPHARQMAGREAEELRDIQAQSCRRYEQLA